jgi:hypothetical protein
VQLPDIDLAAALGEGWTRFGSGTLGELLIGLLVGAKDPELDTAMLSPPDTWTVPAAAGWGGDRWSVYERAGATACVLATRWDSEADAGEFEAALQSGANAKVWRRGDAVVIVAGAPAERAEAVARACFEASPSRPAAGGKRP